MNHPDFGWFPIQTRSENPHVALPVVRDIIRGQSAPGQRKPRPAVAATKPRARLERVLSAAGLANVLSSTTSTHGLVDVTVDRFDGGRYRVGDPIRIRVHGNRAGYLHLFQISPNGRLTQIFPLPGQNNQIEPLKPLTLPAAECFVGYVAGKPHGVHRIVALVTENRIEVTGLAQRRGGSESLFRWHPSESRLVREHVRKPHRQVSTTAKARLKNLVGRWSVDEVAFYVGPAGRKKPFAPAR